MDPASILGAVSAAGAIVAAITKTLHNLSEIRGRFQGADTTIGLLISELSTVKAAVTQIEDWARFNGNGQIQEDVAEAIKVSIEGCKDSMDLLADEVAGLVGDPDRAGAEFLMRAKTVWNDSSMKDHQQRLHTQIGALQLLLQAVTIRSLAGQAALMREPKSRQIFEKVKDDSSSVRAMARSSRAISPTPWSRAQSTIGSTVFPLDAEITGTAVYRRNGARALARHRQNETDTISDAGERRPSLSSSLPRPYQTSSVYQPRPAVPRTPSETQDAHTPITPITPTIQVAETWQKPQAYERSIVSNPLPNRPSGRPALHVYSASDSALPQIPKSPESSKRSLLGLRQHLSRLSLSNKNQLSPETPISPAGARRGRRRSSDKDLSRSIDFTSADGLSAPEIVRAAQSGNASEIEQLIDHGADLESRHRGTGRTALAVAAHCGNGDICKLLLHHGAKVNTFDSSSMTPLHLAASNGHCQSVECLLQEGATIDAPGPNMMTPLRLAVENEFVEAATLLLHRKAKIQTRDAHQLTPLHAAAKSGDEDMVRVLLNYGADVEAKDAEFQAPLHYAAAGGHEGIVDALLNKKANIECPGYASKTPLMCASEAGMVDVVKLLLRKKASTKTKGEGGMSALHYASYEGHVEIIELLTPKKSTTDVRSNDGRTPLHLAAMARNFPAAELLIRKGASTEAVCNGTKRPLHYACEAVSEDIVKLLLGSNADLEAEAQYGQRPLHFATRSGSLPLVGLLLDKGAVIDARDASGERALCLAAAYGHLDLLKSLLDRGAAMRLKFQHGPSHEDSPLCLACKFGQFPVALELITRGSSIRQRDEQSWQPLRYAAYYGWPDLVELLLANGASISGLDPNGGWGFSHTSQRLGFASNTDIDEDRKSRVLFLLRRAEEMEQEAQSAVTASQGFEATPQQDGPAEIDNEASSPAPPSRPPPPNPNTVAGIAALSSFLTPQAPTGFYSLATSEDSTARDTSRPSGNQIREFYASDAFSAPSYSNSTDGPTSSVVSPPTSMRYDSVSAISPMPPSNPPPIPQSAPPVPPQSTDEMDAIRDLRCAACTASEKAMPDLACAECRQAVFKYTYEQSAANAIQGSGSTGDVPRYSAEGASVYEMPAKY